MGKLKDKDIQYVYDAICESPEIQNLIMKIVSSKSVNNNTDIFKHNTSLYVKENENLQSQIAQLRSQLQQANDELEKYKNFYIQAKPKLEKYTYLQNEIDTLKKDVNTYKLELQEKISKIEELENSYRIEKNKNSELYFELESSNKIVDMLKKKLETPMNLLSLYKNLSYSTKSGLENVINDNNEITFIVSCSSENNLSSIWKYAKNISGNTDYIKDFKVLSEIFNYFFDVFNQSLSKPKYIRDNVNIGDEFDDEYHDRCLGSVTSGNITEIILRGYKSINTGRIIHKSLVRV